MDGKAGSHCAVRDVSEYEVDSPLARVRSSSRSIHHFTKTLSGRFVGNLQLSLRFLLGQLTNLVLTGFPGNRYPTAPFLWDRSSIPHITPSGGTISGEISLTSNLPVRSGSV